ncbi:hypothetical protein EDC01DRAFT_648105 [Geopyxis carbonaria]|nr:hypothetical protein EDC01DRAFT_648105 [Geopyxis carbonaria]
MLLQILLHQLLLGSTGLSDATPTGRLAYGWRPDIGNQTAILKSHAPSWAPEPQTRGTWGIIYSCTFTIILTIYSTLHLNIPGPDEGRFNYRFYLRNLKWAAITMIMPEITLHFAYMHWHEAIWLCGDLEEIQTSGQDVFGSKIKSKISFKQFWKYLWAARPNYPLKYGFYVGMGGFVIETKENNGDPKSQSQKAVTANGVLLLANKGIMCEIRPESISDKSKVDIIAKTLAIFQVSWTVVDVIARKICGLPISLLEVHTLVHVACALILYFFWFEKPAGVKDPTILKSEAAAILTELNGMLPRYYSESWRSRKPKETIVERSETLPSVAYYSIDRDTLYPLFGILLLLLTSAAYGGFHLAGWNFIFSNIIEIYTWKIAIVGSFSSVLSLYGTMGIIYIYFYLVKNRSFRETFQYLFRPDLEDLLDFLLLLYMWISSLLSIIVIISRILLIILSYLSLRDSVEGIYLVVPWTQFLPHI